MCGYYLLFYLFCLPVLRARGVAFELSNGLYHLFARRRPPFSDCCVKVSRSAYSSFAGGCDCCASLRSGEGGPCISAGRIDLSRES